MCVGAHALLRARACSCVRLRSAVPKEHVLRFLVHAGALDGAA